MASRLELHDKLVDILNTRAEEKTRVYYQPPSSVQLQYPAIVYTINDVENRSANNKMYRKLPSYTITLIDKNPDSVYVDKLLELPYCQFDRFYTSDNLNHFVFTIYNL